LGFERGVCDVFEIIQRERERERDSKGVNDLLLNILMSPILGKFNAKYQFIVKQLNISIMIVNR
jgi:hypothetical protein